MRKCAESPTTEYCAGWQQVRYGSRRSMGSSSLIPDPFRRRKDSQTKKGGGMGSYVERLLMTLWMPFEIIYFVLFKQSREVDDDNYCTIKEKPRNEKAPETKPEYDMVTFNDSVDALSALKMPRNRAKQLVLSILSADPTVSTAEVIKRALRASK